MAYKACGHISALTYIRVPRVHVCEECVKLGEAWVHLRTCQQCGVTLCCDSSPNRHASAHAQANRHPVIASEETGERWLFCYPHEQLVEY